MPSDEPMPERKVYLNEMEFFGGGPLDGERMPNVMTVRGQADPAKLKPDDYAMIPTWANQTPGTFKLGEDPLGHLAPGEPIAKFARYDFVGYRQTDEGLLPRFQFADESVINKRK